MYQTIPPEELARWQADNGWQGAEYNPYAPQNPPQGVYPFPQAYQPAYAPQAPHMQPQVQQEQQWPAQPYYLAYAAPAPQTQWSMPQQAPSNSGYIDAAGVFQQNALQQNAQPEQVQGEPWEQFFPEEEEAQSAEQLAEQTAPKSKHSKALRIVFDVLFCLLIVAILGGSAAFTLSSNPEKNYLGYRLYAVKTPSMTPKADGSSLPGGFRAGALIAVKICEPETIKEGDIVTYMPGKEPDVYLTHRVVRVLDQLNEDRGLFFVTRGDANNSDDPPIRAQAVIGKKVLAIPAIGHVLQIIRGNYVLSIVTILSAFGFIILIRVYFSPPGKKKSKKKQKNPA